MKSGCGQSIHGILKLTISQEWINRMNGFFLHAGAHSGELKVVSMIFG